MRLGPKRHTCKFPWLTTKPGKLTSRRTKVSHPRKYVSILPVYRGEEMLSKAFRHMYSQEAQTSSISFSSQLLPQLQQWLHFKDSAKSQSSFLNATDDRQNRSSPRRLTATFTHQNFTTFCQGTRQKGRKQSGKSASRLSTEDKSPFCQEKSPNALDIFSITENVDPKEHALARTSHNSSHPIDKIRLSTLQRTVQTSDPREVKCPLLSSAFFGQGGLFVLSCKPSMVQPGDAKFCLFGQGGLFVCSSLQTMKNLIVTSVVFRVPTFVLICLFGFFFFFGFGFFLPRLFQKFLTRPRNGKMKFKADWLFSESLPDIKTLFGFTIPMFSTIHTIFQKKNQFSHFSTTILDKISH